MFDRASKKLGMEQALFQKGAFNENDGEGLANEYKINPKEIENLLKHGAYAFLEEDEEHNPKSMMIEEILSGKHGRKSNNNENKKNYTLQKSQFNIEGGKSSKSKHIP